MVKGIQMAYKREKPQELLEPERLAGLGNAGVNRDLLQSNFRLLFRIFKSLDTDFAESKAKKVKK
jgi:hypothetical protein